MNSTRLPELHLGGVGLADIGDEPDLRDVTDHEDGFARAGPRVDVLTGTDLALQDRARKRRTDEGIGGDRSGFLERVDLLVGLAQQTQAVANGLERDLRRARDRSAPRSGWSEPPASPSATSPCSCRATPSAARPIWVKLTCERALFSAVTAVMKSFLRLHRIGGLDHEKRLSLLDLVTAGAARIFVTRPA